MRFLFVEENSEIVARKLGDEDIHVHEIMHFEGKAVSLINDEYFNKLLMFLLFGSDCTRTFSGTLCYHMKQKGLTLYHLYYYMFVHLEL